MRAGRAYDLARLNADERRALARYFEAVLQAPPRAILASVEGVEVLLDQERKKDLLRCHDTTCIATLGDALGADFVVSGNVDALGPSVRHGRALAQLIEIPGGRRMANSQTW